MKELFEIQQKLEVPRNQYNKFGGFKYRSTDDILMKLKPLLKEYKCVIILNDRLTNIGDRYYVEATATLRNDTGEEESVTAYSRESDVKKGMDKQQITGSASSYARKYALNGLFAIDDGVDADSMDNRKEGTKPKYKKQDNLKATKSSMSEKKATSSQISYIKNLGGKPKEGMTMLEASNLIDDLNAKQK